MSIRKILLFFIVLASLGCSKQTEIPREPWMEKPVAQWPNFALTNEIAFADTTFPHLGNAFLVNTGKDTIAATCKHLFLALRKYSDINHIALEPALSYWKMHPKNAPEESVRMKQLINEDKQEPIGDYNSLKNRDWLIFEPEGNAAGLYPLKVRYRPIRKNETVYAVGWGDLQKDNSRPSITKFRCIKAVGNYYFAKTLTTDIKPNGRSGSPVIDGNGYLIGLTSGEESSMAVIGGINYLKKLFERYGISYKTGY